MSHKKSDLEVATIAASKRIAQVRQFTDTAVSSPLTWQILANELANETETLLAFVRQNAEF